MTTTADRLQELLDQKDERIEELERALSEAEEKADANWTWTVHQETDNDPYPQLPVPRLEMRWIDLRDANGRYRDYPTMIRYDLVYRFYTATEEQDKIVRVPIGGTRTSDKIEEACRWGKFSLPYRDGAHILHDMGHLQLPAFAIVGDRIDRLTWDYVHDKSTATQMGIDHRSDGHSK